MDSKAERNWRQAAIAERRPPRILLVCSANICRSPTAQAVLLRLTQDSKITCHVESRGVYGSHLGEAPDQRAQRSAACRGYDLRASRALQISEMDFVRFDLVLAMDTGHLQALERICPPEHQYKLRMFWPGLDVPDPYYGPPDGFERVLDIIEQGCRRLLPQLRGGGDLPSK